MTIILRPHHINCIYFFKGKGYSDDFINNMSELIYFLINNPNEEIEFRVGFDDICKCCPKNNGTICEDNLKAEKFDKNSLLFYNLDLNRKYTFKEITESFYKNFNDCNLKEVCSDCEWFKIGLCKV